MTLIRVGGKWKSIEKDLNWMEETVLLMTLGDPKYSWEVSLLHSTLKKGKEANRDTN